MNDVFFSIILPVYNAQTFIETTITNVLSQSYPNFELIVVDDGSTDDSWKICKTFSQKDKRVKTFHKQNGGASSARNYAIEKAIGNYVVFCDADDEVKDGWLQAFADKISPCVDVVVAGFIYRTNCMESYRLSVDVSLLTPRKLAEKLSADSTFGYLWNKCFRTDVIQRFHIRFDENARFLEDEDFIGNFWRHIKTVSVSNATEYVYDVPDYDKKYKGLDNYGIYVKMLKYTKDYIPVSEKSEMLRKYTMGCFRCMLLSFQQHDYVEGWKRLRNFVSYGKYYRGHNKYMRIITLKNYVFWFPLLIMYTLIKK